MCSYLEANDEEQITVADLAKKMKEYLCENDALGYGNYYLKQKLQEHYGNSVCFAQKDGLNDVVTMREKTSYILRSHFEADEDIDEEARKMKIIKTAARLLKSDIKTVVPSGTGDILIQICFSLTTLWNIFLAHFACFWMVCLWELIKSKKL